MQQYQKDTEEVQVKIKVTTQDGTTQEYTNSYKSIR